MILTAIIEGLIWSVLWIIYVYIIEKRFPWGRTKTIGRGDECCIFLLEYRD